MTRGATSEGLWNTIAIRRTVGTVFAIDPRSLAAFRIGIGLVLLVDVAFRAWDTEAFFSDAGILPRVVLIEMLGHGLPAGRDHSWSLHLMSGWVWVQWVLLGAAAWFAVSLILGYRTRLAAFASWVLLVSIVNRNPLICDGGDAVLRVMVLWSLFLPMGTRFSLDSLLGGRANRARRPDGTGQADLIPDEEDCPGSKEAAHPLVPGTLVSMGSVAALLQLLTIYFAAGLNKMDAVWTSEFSGVYYAVHCDAFVAPMGIYLRQFPLTMKLLTAGTLLLELGGPILLLLPWGNRWLRCIVSAAFCFFHLGLAATMALGLFPWICIACWMLFVPGFVWQGLARFGRAMIPSPLRSRLGAAMDEIRHYVRGSAWFSRPESPREHCGRLRQVIAGCLLLSAIFWNARDWFDDSLAKRYFPEMLERIASACGMEKGWMMFAPYPRRDDGWLVIRGTLRDGTEVNLWETDRPLPWEKPRLVSGLHHGQRWRRSLENLTLESQAWQRPYFADYVQRRWNKQFAQGRPQREVAQVELIQRLEPTPPPGEPFPPIETVSLWTKHYASD